MRLVLATRNNGKVRELVELLKDYQVEVLSLEQYPDFPEIEEDGDTFEANAIKKAKDTAAYTGLLVLADDSGLEVDCLNGEPGVYSARFAGEPKDDRANNEKLLRLLTDVPREKRGARFRCVAAIAVPGGPVYTAEGVCSGFIITDLRGEEGFGYDPLFYLPEYDKTFAELDLALKNKISHRGRALAEAKVILSKLLQNI
ncbi:non-canonical purine NTP pyrophosphatase, rdgB/HAM1 family [Desulfofarcimen acetoxidans DSM 771]|uniref:dITP/XTP pyrophosphatase n=1 Tax=Desulfofarcimen acetoxidans (strain ATCC 49208 / DSM 771 / KCTC 5769 / VKM B-1644 / 5575) TaxID=485916 RepID=C8VW46_DESAS|nr:XTP/dITP diphosphatase [Desulfofarcimen acetoxidans]ACV64333.1 non-canonical purine NTP pyrophosphatase, rdgB/HAM1 family [Desulfofarcimen acetoxidans DSM 771]